MSASRVFDKVPQGSDGRSYDIFEELHDGSTLWRGCVFGIQNVEPKLCELTAGSKNKFFALDLLDRHLVAIRPRSVKKKSIDEQKRTAQQRS
jgi:hypothetical protein